MTNEGTLLGNATAASPAVVGALTLEPISRDAAAEFAAAPASMLPGGNSHHGNFEAVQPLRNASYESAVPLQQSYRPGDSGVAFSSLNSAFDPSVDTITPVPELPSWIAASLVAMFFGWQQRRRLWRLAETCGGQRHRGVRQA